MKLKKENNNSNLIELLDAVKTSVTEVGFDCTISLLKNGKSNEMDTNIRMAMEAVCEVFEMREHELFTHSKKYPRRYAFLVWVHLCVNIMKYKYENLMPISNRVKITLQKAKHTIDNFPNERHFHQKIHTKKLQAEQILSNKRNK
jgi:hypothetical protein